MTQQPAAGRLVRDLRRWDLVALVINAVIGAGIFGLPSRVFALAGAYSLLAYIAAAMAVFLIVLCFAEVGSRFSATGGPYLYAYATFGPLVGFQVGWLLWVARVASFASLANLFVGYAGYFVPVAGAEPWRSCVILALVLPLAVANVVGVRVTTRVTNAFTAAKLVPLSIFAIVGLFFIEPQRYAFGPPDYGSFSQATLLLVFTFTGFEAASIPTGEMKDPKRHLPFALLAGMGIVALLYILVQAVSIGTLPDLARSERPLADASLQFLGAPGAWLMAVGALASITGTENASLFATPRLLFAMGENRQLPETFRTTHKRFRTPAVAVVVTAAVALVLAIFSTFLSALTISAVVRLITYASTCAALPLLRRKAGAPPPAFQMPGGPLIAALAVVLSIWLLSNSPAREMALSASAVLAGFVLYAAFARGACA